MQSVLTHLKTEHLAAALNAAANSSSGADSAESDMIAAGSPMRGVVDADYNRSADSIR